MVAAPGWGGCSAIAEPRRPRPAPIIPTKSRSKIKREVKDSIEVIFRQCTSWLNGGSRFQGSTITRPFLILTPPEQSLYFVVLCQLPHATTSTRLFKYKSLIHLLDKWGGVVFSLQISFGKAWIGKQGLLPSREELANYRHCKVERCQRFCQYIIGTVEWVGRRGECR